MSREVHPYTFSGSAEALPGTTEAIAMHQQRIQALLAPSPETEAFVAAELQQVVARAAAEGRGTPDEITTVAEGFRWISIGRPGEPVPAMLKAVTSTIGYPTLDCDWDLPHEV